jgi:hypothetical protein
MAEFGISGIKKSGSVTTWFGYWVYLLLLLGVEGTSTYLCDLVLTLR